VVLCIQQERNELLRVCSWNYETSSGCRRGERNVRGWKPWKWRRTRNLWLSEWYRAKWRWKWRRF